MESLLSNSRNFLTFKACKTCAYKPCERLRFGRVFPGKYCVLHARYLTTQERDCPFLVQSFSDFLDLADNASLLDIIGTMQDVLADFSVEEQLAFDARSLISDYSDRQGRLVLLEGLWNSSVLTVLYVPYNFHANQRMAKWLLAHETLEYQQQASFKKDQKEDRPVTDVLADQATKPITIDTPWWQHANAEKKEKAPDKAGVNDALTLFTRTTNVGNGEQVTFTIYDISGETPQKVDSVTATVSDDNASTAWKIPAKAAQQQHTVTLKIEGLSNQIDTQNDEIVFYTATGVEKRIKVSSVGESVDINDLTDDFTFSVENTSSKASYAFGDGAGSATSRQPSIFTVQASVKNKKSDKCEIKVSESKQTKIILSIECNKDIPNNNDSFTLSTADDGFSAKKSLGNVSGNSAKVEFSNVPDDAGLLLSVGFESGESYNVLTIN